MRIGGRIKHSEDPMLRQLIAQRLKTARNMRGMTQQDVIDLLHVDHAALSRWEKGAGTPRLETCVRFARALGISLDYLTGLSDTASPADQTARGARMMKLPMLDIALLDSIMETLIERSRG